MGLVSMGRFDTDCAASGNTHACNEIAVIIANFRYTKYSSAEHAYKESDACTSISVYEKSLAR